MCLSGVLALSASACVAGKLDGSFSPESKGKEGTLDDRVSTLNSSGDPISAWVLTSNDVSSLLVRPDSALGSRPSALGPRLSLALLASLARWHDVPMYDADGDMNFVCEIPVNTTAKFELQTEEPGNPIAQDDKDGKPRNHPIPILWNYGMVPQTWEDPEALNEDLGGAGGDNDPMDVVEIAARPCTTGSVYHVKPICAFAMLDDGEVDWKLVVIPVDRPEAAKISNAKDAEREFPGELEAIRTWFRDYKTVKNVNGTLEPSGDPPAEFGFDEACLDGDQLATVLQDGADWYQALVSGERQNTEEKALPEIVPAIVDGPGLTSAAVARHLLIAVPALLALVA